MSELFVDRFLLAGGAWLDLATGASVRIRMADAPKGGGAFAWNDWCAALAMMRHPLVNALVDYGPADTLRVFEAYSAGAPVWRHPSAASHLLPHAARFLSERGIHLDRDTAALALRQVAADARLGRSGRPVGVILQPRRAIADVIDALGDAAPGGVVRIDLAGGPGSGVRTARALIARAARISGYVPVSASVLSAVPRVTASLRDRHVCLLLEGPDGAPVRSSAASLLADLGVTAARRHVVICFWRAGAAPARALRMDAMGLPAMAAMVLADPEVGSEPSRVFEAAQRALGNPGRFLRHLGAAPLDPPPARDLTVVHETAPPYLIESPAPQHARARVPRRPGLSLLGASDRARRLAARGRHAAAVRLLERAARVFEGRHDRDGAAASAVQLGWILRDRGRSDAALEQFTRARQLAVTQPNGLAAALGIAIVWTDERRFAEAEASLRATLAAAELIGERRTAARARVALARCLYWQNRLDDAAGAADSLPAETERDVQAYASALLARVRVDQRNYPAALAAATRALECARPVGGRLVATAARAVAIVHTALGDWSSARTHLRMGLVAAAEAHTPLLALRLRSLLLNADPGRERGRAARLSGQIRWALRHRALPPLLREQLESALRIEAADATPVPSAISPALEELQRLIEAAHGASDDATGAEAVCSHVCDSLRAASVQIVAAGQERRLLARAGRPWVGDLHFVERVIAGGPPVWPAEAGEPPRAAEAVRYGSEVIGVLACRWPAGAQFDAHRAASSIRAAALACAPSVRGMLDRVQPPAAEPCWRDLIGDSPAAEALRAGILRAARAPFPVLIEGESGSGKELVARAIHRLSARRDRRLCVINCAAISEELLEAELFGHARGAFTGAVGERAGLFEEADGGTLFLDEVGELSARAQAKLLRVLQDGEVRRVGENLARRVDARVLAATNRDLEEEAAAGRFRPDLRFRLDVVRISVPPLRDRTTDIAALAAHFWEDAARRVGSRATLSPETISALARYDWPGNVRQLQNVIASLAVHAPRRGRVPPSLLPAHVARSAGAIPASFEAAREEFERRFVAAALARAGGQRARAARALGVSRQGLAKMLRRLGLDRTGVHDDGS